MKIPLEAEKEALERDEFESEDYDDYDDTIDRVEKDLISTVSAGSEHA
jgi:hypothetical protein